jgi:DNA topoisomerase-1
VIKFDGFLHVYLESTDDENDENAAVLLPPVKVKDNLSLRKAIATERFTQRPPRYSEASLVRKLEELGIGRPSTYAPTISTIQNREYVEKSNIEGVERKYNVLTLENNNISDKTKTETAGADKGKLVPTDIGMVVSDFLTKYFPDILDYNFTANVEKEFDHVAEGKEEWTKMIDRFYKVFHPVVDGAMTVQTEHKVGERVLGNDPKTGLPVSVKIGRFGPMVQIGSTGNDEKPLFAGLQKNQSMSAITLEEALKLFDLPRNLGEFEDKSIVVGVGRFGPYVRHNNQFVSLPKGADPYSITSDEAIALILEKRKKDSEKLIKTFVEDAGIQILNGRYGPYISYQKSNYKIPKSVNPAELSYEECIKIINGEAKGAVKEKSPKKKTTAKAKAK